MADETYTIRLIFQVKAPNHANSVRRVIDQLARYGILEWVYQTERLSDSEIRYFNGDIDPVDLEDLRRSLAEDDNDDLDDDFDEDFDEDEEYEDEDVKRVT